LKRARRSVSWARRNLYVAAINLHANFALDLNFHCWINLNFIQASCRDRRLRVTYFVARNLNETREEPLKSRCFVSAWETETSSLLSRPVSWETKHLCHDFSRFLVLSGAPGKQSLKSPCYVSSYFFFCASPEGTGVSGYTGEGCHLGGIIFSRLPRGVCFNFFPNAYSHKD